MKYFEEKYLLYFYKDLYKYSSVIKSGDVDDNKYELIRKYMDRLDNFFNNISSNNLSFFKKSLYSKYIITEDNIPTFSKNGKLYTESDKEGIILNQRQSFDNWFNYLTSSSLDCPMWIRFFIFKSILSLGNYDYNSDKFCKRSKRTINAFPIFNQKAVDNVISYLKKLSFNFSISENDFNTLVENGSFNKLYSKQLKLMPSSSETNGIWKTYSKDDYKRLNNDLKNMTVDWCIKRGYEASEFLEVGDIKVFYTMDEFGDFTIPRLCIREVFGNVVEVRGVKNNKQDVEDSMLEILQDELIKYDDLDFNKKVINLKYLRDIYKKYKNGIDLNKTELRFIYEIDDEIDNFGINSTDNRIREMKENRNLKKDIAFIFDLNENDIATSLEELKENKKLFLGDIKILDKRFIDDIIIPKIVIGNLIFPRLINSDIFKNLEFVSGRFNVFSMEELDNLNNLSFVRDYISFGPVEYNEILDDLSKNNKVFIDGVFSKYSLKDKVRVRE